MKKNLGILSIIMAALMMMSCATTVSYKVERPAELNLNGANSISVLPFQDMDYNGRYVFGMFRFSYTTEPQKAADYLTQKIVSDLVNANYLAVVPASQVERAIYYHDKVPCDVYLTGYISNWYTHVDSTKHTNDDGSVYYTYRRYVKCKLTYEVRDASDGERVISFKTMELNGSSSSYNHVYDIPSGYSLIESDLSRAASKIIKQIQPYTETVTVSLMADKSKEKDQNFKDADTLVKKGLYAQAEDRFYEIYRITGKYEAGYNAARLMQVQGKLTDALNLMNEVYRQSGDKKVANAIKQIQNEINQSSKLQNQLNAKENKNGTM